MALADSLATSCQPKRTVGRKSNGGKTRALLPCTPSPTANSAALAIAALSPSPQVQIPAGGPMTLPSLALRASCNGSSLSWGAWPFLICSFTPTHTSVSHLNCLGWVQFPPETLAQPPQPRLLLRLAPRIQSETWHLINIFNSLMS